MNEHKSKDGNQTRVSRIKDQTWGEDQEYTQAEILCSKMQSRNHKEQEIQSEMLQFRKKGWKAIQVILAGKNVIYCKETQESGMALQSLTETQRIRQQI